MADDLSGRQARLVRYHHIGEGAYEQTEATIRRLLAEQANPS